LYIDGNHYYDFVKHDLALYFYKVKVGGFLVLDDVLWRDDAGTRPVMQAITEFLTRMKFAVQLVTIHNNQCVLLKCHDSSAA